MVSGIYDLWSLISGPVISAYGDLEGGYVVRADGGRQKWWRRCRCPVVCAAHCATASCTAGLAAAGLVLQVCLAASLAAAGPLQGRYTRPPFNGAAAVKCFSAVFKFSVFFLRGFKQEQKYLRIAI